jgi:hypothetical protein
MQAIAWQGRGNNKKTGTAWQSNQPSCSLATEQAAIQPLRRCITRCIGKTGKYNDNLTHVVALVIHNHVLHK